MDDDHVVGVGVLVLQHLVANYASQAGRLAVHGLHVATRVALAHELLQAKTTAPRCAGSPLIVGVCQQRFQAILNEACTHKHTIGKKAFIHSDFSF